MSVAVFKVEVDGKTYLAVRDARKGGRPATRVYADHEVTPREQRMVRIAVDQRQKTERPHGRSQGTQGV